MASKAGQRRLQKEYKLMVENPTPYIKAQPSEANILEWHYLITGPPNTPYEGGQYHGTLSFTHEYPFKPPAIRMVTPNGRFQPNTRLCLSMSDYHPDLWNPAWSVATILNGLLSFMTGNEPTTGSIQTSDEVKRKHARESYEWNANSNLKFICEFPELIKSNLKKDKEWKDEIEKAKLSISEKLEKREETPIDLNTLDPEDRVRYLATLQKKGDYFGEGYSHMVYYVLAVALVLGFIRVAA